MYSDSVNRNDFVPSFGPSFDPPPSPSRSENHVPLKRATRVLMRAWRPQPQGSTASQWSASAKVESQDSQRLGSQISTPRGSPSKMEKLLNSLKTTVDAFEVQRQAAEDQRQADEVKRQAAEAVAAQRHEDSKNLTQNLTAVLVRLTEQLAKLDPPVPRTSS